MPWAPDASQNSPRSAVSLLGAGIGITYGAQSVVSANPLDSVWKRDVPVLSLPTPRLSMVTARLALAQKVSAVKRDRSRGRSDVNAPPAKLNSPAPGSPGVGTV
jgi:hypothetical protein